MNKLTKLHTSVGAYNKPNNGKILVARVKTAMLAIGGGIVGLVNGLLGGGGGSLVVPMLHSLGDYSERNAHASAILAVLPLSIVSGAIYAARGNFPIKSGLLVSVGVVIGGVIGSLILKKINPRLLSVLFYGIMIYSGAKMVM